MPFLDSLDVGNRALQHLGVPLILDVTEDNGRNQHVSFAYDKVRRPELRRNNWRFAMRTTALRAIDTTTMLLAPLAYDATKMYLPGSVVADPNGQLWFSMVSNNINNTPGDTDIWDAYFGPLTVSAYDSGTGYYSGELVYLQGAFAGSYAVYMSLVDNNTVAPNTVTTWDATVTYHTDDVITYLGNQYKSTSPVNLGITPFDGSAYPAFDPSAVYSIGQQVTGSDNNIYTSLQNTNVGHDPIATGVYWTANGQANAWTMLPSSTPAAALNWRVISAKLLPLRINYPIGTGPMSNSASTNVFRLPAGYLKVAPQAPKAGSTSFLGAPSGLPYGDWIFQGNYLITSELVVIFRFVADIQNVQDMDDMFCEGLACRIAIACCETLTQSATKIQTAASEYKIVMGEARLANAIENGPIEPPEDDYITCRA